MLLNWFLCTELVAGECKDFESLRVILVIKFDKLGIVGVRQASFRSHINDAENCPAIAVHLDIDAIHVPILYVVKVTCCEYLFFTEQEASRQILHLEEGSLEKQGHDALKALRSEKL